MTITHRFTEIRTGRTLDRVELQKLLTLVRNHEIDAVVVGKLDRLSRNVAQLSMIAETCHNEGVELHYADFGIDTNTSMGRMIRNMRASYAEFEADIIYERTQGGRKAVMLSGQILGAAPSAPYGHMFTGEKKGKLMIRNEEEAAVILLMRDWILNDGYGTPTIARLLNERFISTPGRAAEWMAGVVYHILTDHSIAGTYYHNRFRRNKRGDKYPARTDPSEWIPIAIEEIITKEDFHAIQKNLASNRQLSTRNSKYFYLLGRRIFCSCGRSLSGDIHGKHRVYRCTGSKSIAPNQCRPTVSLRCDVVDPVVWEWIVTQLEPETLRLGLLAEREKSAQTLEELIRQKAMYQTQMKELSSRLERIQQGFNGGFYTLAPIG
jgi:site-specific DNA recombinase